MSSKSKSKSKSNKSDLDAIINVNIKKNSDSNDSNDSNDECENCGAGPNEDCASDCGDYDYVKICEVCKQEKCKPSCQYYGLPDESESDNVDDEECEYCGAGPGEDCASDCEGGESSASDEDEDEACEACGASPDEDCYSDCDCEECVSDDV